VRLYAHWPFCLSRCAYCDFNSRVAARRHMEAYRLALYAELEAWACMLEENKRRLSSIYLGGGTPSTLSGAEISALLGKMTGRFMLHSDAEVTVEVNPANWSYEDFTAACAGGVNRMSIGVQSLHDPSLRLLGRAHDRDAAMEAVRHALRCGVRSVSTDLLYGLPGMDVASLERCLDEILETGPQHLSIYALTLSGRSPLSLAVSRGEVSLPCEDEVADQYMAAVEKLRTEGYEHYEISNFCLPGHHSRHNLAYWKREEYLGLGAGAHSLLGRCRFYNTDSILGYVNMLGKSQMAVDGWELLDAADEREEAIMLGLRTSRGVPENILDAGGDHLDDLEFRGLLARRLGRVSLTTRGMLVSNSLIAALLSA